MKITFRNKHIYDAPIDILKHLYYYTVQYGLSVAQFTGKNPEYWRKLPYVLKENIGNENGLKKLIDDLETVSEKHDERLACRREQMKTGWKSKEVVLNAQLDSLLLALPNTILAEAFQLIAPVLSKDVPKKYDVVGLEIRGDDGNNIDFVEPDLLLKSDEQLLMIELKTKGWAQSTRKYPPGQLLNYLRLAMECKKFGVDNIENFVHLIIAPTDDLVWLENNDKWIRHHDKATGLLNVDYEACFKVAEKPKRIEADLIEFVARFGKEIPIYLCSWNQMSNTFGIIVEKQSGSEYYEHWKGISEELEELAKRASKFV